MSTSSMRASFLSFTGRAKILHTTWLAFFVTFLVWFNHAPLIASMRETFGLTDQQIKTLLILNVALTIPARIIVGMLVDAFGPRRMYALLLFISSFLCFGFAMADDFERLAIHTDVFSLHGEHVLTRVYGGVECSEHDRA